MIFMVIGANAQAKRNERSQTPAQAPTPQVATAQTGNYSYSFSQPDFKTSRVTITHASNGRGTILFERSDSSAAVTDPVEISEPALSRINKAISALDYLGSDENYQYEKDYSHLGTAVFAFEKDGARRQVTINYTENPHMRAILDEYRKIGQQAIWAFDIALARDNQPLEAPGLMDMLDGYLRRGEISDPPQLLPFLKELSMDERLPLIARNKAQRIIAKIEKSRK